MDYEKAYKEALERAKNLHKDAIDMDENIRAKQCEIIFPELKESEDEQSKKWILEYLYDGLRKSDEQFKDDFKTAIAWLEKQGEQKPAEWSEIDEEEFQIAIDTLFEAGQYGSTDWLTTLKNRYAWEPSDEQMDALKEATNIVGSKYKSCLNALYSDLKKLKY